MRVVTGELQEHKRKAPTRSHARAGVALASLLLAVGCTTESSTGSSANSSPSRPAATAKVSAPSPEISTSTGSTNIVCSPGTSYEADKRYANDELQSSKLIGVQLRLGEHACYESLVIQLGGDDSIKPGIHAHYVNAPIRTDPRNKKLNINGNAFLQIDLGASLHDAAGQLIASRTVGPSDGVINEVVITSDYEGQSSLVVGLDEKLPFRLTDVVQPEGCPDICEVINIG